MMSDDVDAQNELKAPTPPSATSPFVPPMTIGGNLPPLDMGRTQFSPQSRQSHPRRQTTGSISTHSSLESMYAAVPELGTEGGRLRVERTEPKRMPDGEGGYVRVGGVLGYLVEGLTTEQFARRFGGNKYRVYAERLIEDKDRGVPMWVDTAVTEMEFPLDPNLDDLPIVADDSQEMDAMSDTMGGEPPPYRKFSPNRNRFFVNQSGPKTGDVLDAVRMGAEFGRGNQSHDDSSALHFLSGLSNEQVRMAREYADRQNEILLRQIEEKDRSVQEMRMELRELQNRPTSQGETLQGVAAIVGSLRGSTGDMEASQLRSQHEREIERLSRQHKEEKESLRRESERTLDNMRVQAEAEKNMLRSSAEAEKARYTERERDWSRDLERREQNLRDEMERRESAARRDAEREIASIRQGYEMQIQTLKSSFDQQIGMQRMHSEVLNKQTEQSGTVQIQALQRDIAILTAERERLVRENDDFRVKINKTPIEAIQEAHQLASITGMRPADGGEPETPDKSNTDKIIDALASGIEKGAPAAIAGLGSLAQGLAHRVSTPAPAPAQGKVTVQRVEPNPPKFVDDDAAPMRLSAPQQRPAQAPEVERPPMQQQAQQQQVQQTQQPAPAQRPPEPPPESPWKAFEWTGLPEDTLFSVCTTIETVIVDKGSPADAKTRLEEAFGAEVVRVIADMAEVDKIIASVSQAPATKSSNMNSAKGRKFLRNLWKELNKPVEATA